MGFLLFVPIIIMNNVICNMQIGIAIFAGLIVLIFSFSINKRANRIIYMVSKGVSFDQIFFIFSKLLSILFLYNFLCFFA